MMSTIHRADVSGTVKCREKGEDGTWDDIVIDHPDVIADYNHVYGGS